MCRRRRCLPLPRRRFEIDSGWREVSPGSNVGATLMLSPFFQNSLMLIANPIPDCGARRDLLALRNFRNTPRAISLAIQRRAEA